MAPVCINHSEHRVNNNHEVNVPSLRRALVNRNYAKLWYGQAVSAVGDTVFGTTLVLWVSQVLVHGSPWAPAAVSGILVAAGAAVGLVGPVAGATGSAAGIIGPPIAGLLLVTVGFQWALAVNASSYVVSYLAIRLLRLAPGPRPPSPAGAGSTGLYAEFSAGLRLFACNRFLV